MGVIFSCAFTSSDDLDTLFESSRDKVFSFGGDDSKGSILLGPKAQDPNLSTLRSSGSGKMMIPRSPASGLNPQMMIQSITLEGKHASVDGGSPTKDAQKPLVDSDGRKYQAAVKLQKTYKSFRTRRQLADCAVLMEQKWWSLVEHYHLKRSSISFFEVEKPQTAVSRWSRGKTKAAKVGKGLLRDEKARKLALQHWLEAIDPRHRYGHNLQFYYTKWLHCTSKQPFFYWLDVGEGRDVNLERCPRTKLHMQCIKYLDPAERSAYEVIIVDGKLMYKQTRELLDTRGTPEDVKWIFVLSVHKVLYVGQKKKGTFQHSSFLSGGATLSAGRLVVEEGILKAVWPHSGHYLPTEENFEELIVYLSDNNVDLSVVQRAPSNGEEDVSSTTSSLRTSTSVPDLKVEEDTEDIDASIQHSKDDEYVDVHPTTSRWSRRSRSKISPLTIPSRRSENVHELFWTPKPQVPCTLQSPKSPSDGYETPEDMLFDDDMSVSKHNLFDNEEEKKFQEPVSKEKIMKRINSHKGMKSYQLAKQLSCRWTTGAGPRIGCVRDYPSELQSRVLEEVCLSPQSASSGKSERLTLSHRVKSPLGISSAIAEE